MDAKVFDISNGVVEYNDIKLVRIKSKRCNYLIMEDHTPVIGQVNGEITILQNNKEIILTDIKGYFMHKNNSFELIVEDKIIK